MAKITKASYSDHDNGVVLGLAYYDDTDKTWKTQDLLPDNGAAFRRLVRRIKSDD